MAIETFEITDEQLARILHTKEGHFFDGKDKDIAPGKLTNTISAFANADGGDLYVGIREDTAPLLPFIWDGFADPEDANAHLAVFDDLFPLGHDYSYDLLTHATSPGYVLKASINKTKDIIRPGDGIPRVRRGAQNLRYDTPDKLRLLERNKGITSFEDEPVATDLANVCNSETVLKFILEVIPTSEPEVWLRKEQIIRGDKPSVAGVMLFADLPQAILPKRTGIKVYRYKTAEEEGERDTLVGNPASIEGSAYDIIRDAVKLTVQTVTEIPVLGTKGFETSRDPVESLHEVITNAVLHRDYALKDDIHVRIFDNRVEVESPGKLAAHMTVGNLLRERFSRNGNLVRIINKFPNPPNKDVGEGLNTAINALRAKNLEAPEFTENDHSFLVQINHRKRASAEDLVMEYLQNNAEITNRIARQLTGIKSENTMKNVFNRLKGKGMIRQVYGKTGFASAWEIVAGA